MTSPRTALRLFFAINFPPELRETLYRAGTPLRTAAPGVRWTPGERLHLTVKFLGEQPAGLVDRLGPAVDAAAAGHRCMELALGGVGAFPNFRRPRVVWLGVVPSPPLALLYEDVDVACEHLGLPRETRPFRPHVTLGRVRPGTPPAQLRALAAAAESVDVEGVTWVETLDLMESVSAAGGPKYVTRHSSPLVPR